MDIIKIDQSNIHIYYNLSQIYEAEFAPLTGEMPNQQGLYTVQTEVLNINDTYGYLKYQNQIPVGFMVIKDLGKYFDVAEFFILPSFRRKKLGSKFAQNIIKSHKGRWQIRQIQGADYAVNFWLRVISELVGDNYRISSVNDSEWGRVTRQEFYIY
ncbi:MULTISPECIES: hypothetical protein [Francisella]|uniref:GNAT family N-acetyltransferase n=1 Tax=Francisella opportunistica TaxID=2016517 RepID=A0A345JSU2_9GAMM|nr:MULTISPECIES: hypothetical protein [Francisella]APC92166.1 hypothetical protein BBG19_1438 [Francisella sp. MA067296]AXH30388.1 hypothetical protein CGC43_07245 [Francisella opportunistica]AXH32028.1 hypothetical protein CGC44_07220 [Francisella opportunistica]AXH33676.1 hypothetical protein CGC45_07250 [Francisella opportunistica]